MKPPYNYKFTGVAGSRVVEGKNRVKSPSIPFTVEWGKEHGVDFVIRFWPSKKGWRALDIRKAQVFIKGGHRGRQFKSAVGYVQGTRIYPNAESAVMHLMAVMNGSQGELL